MRAVSRAMKPRLALAFLTFAFTSLPALAASPDLGRAVSTAAAACDGTPESLPAAVDDGVRLSKIDTEAVPRWNVALRAPASSVLRGRANGLPVGSACAGERCLLDNAVAAFETDADIPTSGDALWYLVRGDNACGGGPYGFEVVNGAAPQPRVSATCP
jgi:hypothetical protein